VNLETKLLLKRWESLRSGAGWARAVSVVRLLWFLRLILFFGVAIGLYHQFSPAVLVVVSVVLGWVNAECNALKLRMAQWPIISAYIDWGRVDSDLNGGQ
jgi:hypothetical protein